ncbi:sphingomyelin synthetase, partial [Reticulomyxa filosa]
KERFTPFVIEYKSSPDVGQYVILGISFVWLVTCCKQPFIVFRRFLMIHSFLFLCRASCLLGTQLPNPYQGYPMQQWSDNILYEALLVNLRYKITRTDVFYSGHTVSMTCLALMIEYYHDNTPFQRFLSIFVWMLTLITLYLIIAVKFHYTIDVLIAFQLTIFTWKIYHMATESHMVRQSIPILDFLEGDVIEQNSYSDTFQERISKSLSHSKQL